MRRAAEARENRSAGSDSVTPSMGSAVRGILRAKILGMGFFLQGDVPDPGTEARSLALLVDSQPSEPPGNTAAEARVALLSPSRPGFLSWLREGSGPPGLGREVQTTERARKGQGMLAGVWWTQERLFLRSGIRRFVPMGWTRVAHQEAGSSSRI